VGVAREGSGAGVRSGGDEVQHQGEAWSGQVARDPSGA
jgi:hypothetical protein